MRYRFQIPGPSVPQGSARAFVVNGKAVITSANKGLSAWRSHAVRCIHDQMEQQGIQEPISGPVGLHLMDYRMKPKGRPKKAVWADKRPDLDKILRALGDAIEDASLLISDAQICYTEATKVYAARARIEFEVWVLEQ